MNDELQAYRRQFEAVEKEARTIVDGLTDVQLMWQPQPGHWSIRDCFDHLVVTGRCSLLHINETIREGRRRGVYLDGPFRHPMIERLLVWLLGAPPRLKFRAPGAYEPARKDSAHVVIREFLLLQTQMSEALVQANGLDLVRLKVRNPVSRWLQFGLGQEFAFTLAHERRHLWQISRVKAHPSFPAASGQPLTRRSRHDERGKEKHDR